MLDSHTHDDAVWKGAVAGALGGLVASYAMNQFQAVTKKLSADGQGEAEKNGGEDATVKTAEAITGAVGHPLSEDEKKVAGPLVHYAFGTAMGAAYGALAELSPKVSLGAGVPFGTAVWLGADEVAVPALGLSKKPAESPPAVHAYALASHVVYGLATDLVRRAVLSVI